MLIQPSKFDSTPVNTLIEQAGLGRIGFDQRLVKSLTSRPKDSVPALVRYGLDTPESARLQIDSDLLNLLAAMPGNNGLDYVISLLRDGFSEIPESMLDIARRAGSTAVDALVTLYRELEEDSSSEVAFLLSGLGLRDPRILQINMERLEFDMEDGAMLLGLYGDKAGIPALEKLSIELGKNREIDFALEQLRQSNGEAYFPEIDHLADYPETAGPEFEVLDDDEIVEFATSYEDESVRLAALDVLEDLDLPQSVAEPLIKLASSADSVLVRAAAFRALARLNQIEEVRALADATLGNLETPPAIRAASLITLLPDSISPVRTRALIDESRVPRRRSPRHVALSRSCL